MASSTKPSIAFIGLGAMGFGMATHLVTAGYNVTGYDLWGPSLQKFVAAGGISSTTPREAANGKPILVFMVATGAQANAALFDKENGALVDLPKNATIIHCSTAAPEHVPEMRKLLDGQGRQDVELVDAPVSGGTIRAANGTLTILASGPESSLSSGKQVLDEMAGGNLYVIPGGLGAGTKVKMVHQVLAGIHITMASEAMGFAAALGLNTKETLDYLSQSSGASWMLANRGPRILEVDPVVASALNIITKDVGIVTVAGRKEKFPLFLSSATEQVLATGVRSNLGTIDDSQLIRIYLPSEPDLVAKQATSTHGITDADSKLKLKLVESVLAGVHMASAAEAMNFGAKVGLDTSTLFEIIKGAAGASAMFVTRVPLLLSGEWEAKSGGLTIGNHMEQLKIAIDEAAKIKYPLHLAATALQLFELAAVRGLEDNPDVSLVRLWDSSVKVFFERSSI